MPTESDRPPLSLADWKNHFASKYPKLIENFPPQPLSVMRSCYIDFETRTIADLMPLEIPNIPPTLPLTTHGWMLTRINVPAMSRGQGFGSRMLKAVLADADRLGEIIYLDILPTGPLGYEDLKAWYQRHGFRLRSGPGASYKRLPRADQPYQEFSYYRQNPTHD